MAHRNSSEIDYDEVFLLPVPSDIDHRGDVDLSTKLGPISLKLPIMSSPMKSITSVPLIAEMDRLGGMGFMHRFYQSDYERIIDIDALYRGHVENFGVAVALNDDFYLSAPDYGAKIICVDVANGYLKSVLNFCMTVKDYLVKNNYECILMAGNVVTMDGAENLKTCGVDIVRVGIGSGQLCTTRDATGIGRGQLSALLECSFTDALLVSDGGINAPGRAVQSFVFGADAVMLGSVLATANEAGHEGAVYGNASEYIQNENYSEVKSIEGTFRTVYKLQPLEGIINEFAWGIRSACTYLNAHNLNELTKGGHLFVDR